MNEQLHFRQAQADDTELILEIIGQAKAQMKVLGSTQWQGPYPTTEDIGLDLAHGAGWVLCDNGQVIAYGAAIFDGEPAYAQIEGQWLTEGPYVVVHRLAVADQAKHRGVATEFMRRVEALAQMRGIGSLRVDTNFDNGYMLRILSTLGFTRCGEIEYKNGRRIAFEKVIRRT